MTYGNYTTTITLFTIRLSTYQIDAAEYTPADKLKHIN